MSHLRQIKAETINKKSARLRIKCQARVTSTIRRPSVIFFFCSGDEHLKSLAMVTRLTRATSQCHCVMDTIRVSKHEDYVYHSKFQRLQAFHTLTALIILLF